MKKITKITGVIFCILLICNNIFGQNSTTDQIKDRYININNIDDFFLFKDTEVSELVKFELFNIYENESSKPLFVNVNELSDVIKFTIKSHSTKHENQRTCYLKLKKTNYLITFKQVLKRMQVKYIKTNNDFIELDKYFAQLD
ncbi:MAG: hypothetical protein PHW82_14970 [Bacteroidales bacterium]|nr:hypothetical protein [Bacteroidales bacterium]